MLDRQIFLSNAHFMAVFLTLINLYPGHLDPINVSLCFDPLLEESYNFHHSPNYPSHRHHGRHHDSLEEQMAPGTIKRLLTVLQASIRLDHQFYPPINHENGYDILNGGRSKSHISIIFIGPKSDHCLP